MRCLLKKLCCVNQMRKTPNILPWYKKAHNRTSDQNDQVYSKYSESSRPLHSKALFTRDISAHYYCDKKIKEYYNIWQFLATNFYWPTKVSSYKSVWPIDIYGPKISLYRNIFLSQYCVQKYFMCCGPQRGFFAQSSVRDNDVNILIPEKKVLKWIRKKCLLAFFRRIECFFQFWGWGRNEL